MAAETAKIESGESNNSQSGSKGQVGKIPRHLKDVGDSRRDDPDVKEQLSIFAERSVPKMSKHQVIKKRQQFMR